jgi:hypothetical protein|tara:strand:- start:57 stop:245 length:189 start_codon:yes stop_codon:yes gene_type:complete
MEYQVDAHNSGAQWAQGPEYKKLAKKHEEIKNSDEYKKTQEKFARVDALHGIANDVVKAYHN